MASELAYKRRLRELHADWSCAYETRSGSTVGYPDLQLLVGERRLVLPVEVKVGELKSGKLLSRQIRPSQISWHHEFWSAGGIALIVVCFGPVASMEAWALPSGDREVTSKWKEGWPLESCNLLVSKGKNMQDLDSLVEMKRRAFPFPGKSG